VSAAPSRDRQHDAAERLSVSVVVPTFERREQLLRTLAPLRRDPGPDEIVVVVDGGRDGSLESVEALASEDDRFTPLFVENRGLVLARVVGAERARGDIVLFLDDDVIPSFGLAGGHALRHAERDGLVVLGYMPTLLPPRRRPGQFPAYLYAYEYERRTRAWERDPGEMLRSFWAGNHSLRRADFLEVTAGIDRPISYHEDLDFGLRCLAAGLEGVFDRSLMARHEHRHGPAAFERDAARSGTGLWRIHARDPERMPAPTPERLEAGLPAPARALLAAARRPGWEPAVLAALRGLVRLAGRCHAYRVEDLAAEMLRRCLQQRAIAAAANGVP
jgi:GT2 family glycosyltransferase